MLYSGISSSVIFFLVGALIAFPVYLTPVIGDSLHYRIAFDNAIEGINSFGIEIVFYYLSRGAHLVGFDYRILLFVVNSFLIYVYLLFFSRERVNSHVIFLLMIVFLFSPFYILNSAYLVRTYIGLGFFLLAVYSKNVPIRLIFALMSITSQTYFLLPLLAFSIRAQKLLLSQKFIAIFFVFFIVQKLGVFPTWMKLIQDNSSILINFDIANLNRKINVLEHGVGNLGIMDYHRFFLVLFGIYYLALKGVINTMRPQSKFILSAFVLTSVIALSVDGNIILLNRIGFLAYFCFFFAFVVFWSEVRLKNPVSIIFIVYSIMVTVYSFIYNDLVSQDARILLGGSYMLSGLIDYF